MLDAKRTLERIKLNRKNLNECQRHYFGNIDKYMPLHMTSKFTCLNCNGTIGAIDAFNYVQGYKAAGRNPNDIIVGYE